MARAAAALRRPTAREALVGLFVGFVPAVLALDSPAISGGASGWQAVDLAVVPAFLALLIGALDADRRLLVLLVVPVTAFGEVLLSAILGLYGYRLGTIPLYVPFGHATLFAATLLWSETAFVARHERAIRSVLLGLSVLLGAAAVVLGDTFSIVLGVLFGYAMWRSRARTFYLLMGVTVLYVECTGAFLGTWRWGASPLGILHTTNPPLAVAAIYILGDAGILRLAAYLRACVPRVVPPPHLVTNLLGRSTAWPSQPLDRVVTSVRSTPVDRTPVEPVPSRRDAHRVARRAGSRSLGASVVTRARSRAVGPPGGPPNG
jgi:hypothetical protein